jgi:bla regulator protein blaR1
VILNLGRKAVLIAAVAMVVALPIRFGVARGQSATATSGTPKYENATEAPQFDVVSIKPTPPSDDKTLIMLLSDGDSFHAFHGATARMILRTAFGVEDDYIIGAPSWVNSNRYDVEAKVTAEDAPKLNKLNAQERHAILIPILAERFHLKYHHETRERSTYALVVAKGGPKLTKGEPDPPGGPKPADPNHPEDPTKEHHRIMTIQGRIEADSVPMYVLADQLTRLQLLGRTVVDKTGLTGNYNFTLRWTPDNALPSLTGNGASGLEHAESATDAAAPSSIFTAIQEQLGLKLESERDSVGVIVIDRIDPPSPN